VKLLRTVRLDASDTFVFGAAAEPGEWAVSGAFVFWDKQTSSPSIGLSRIDPTIHDPPAYECLQSLRPFPGMKQQSIHVVRPFIDGKPCQRH
jgi:hypothetical protein